MLRVLADENFNGEIVRGLLRQQPELDIVRVQDVGLSGADDLDVLAWAAADGRVVFTHDRGTMSRFAAMRMAAGETVAGVFILSDQYSLGRAIQELLLICECSEQSEWAEQVVFVPLRL